MSDVGYLIDQRYNKVKHILRLSIAISTIADWLYSFLGLPLLNVYQIHQNNYNFFNYNQELLQLTLQYFFLILFFAFFSNGQFIFTLIFWNGHFANVCRLTISYYWLKSLENLSLWIDSISICLLVIYYIPWIWLILFWPVIYRELT